MQSKDTFKTIITLSLPVMAGMVLQSLLATVDMYFVSNLGTTNAAAISLGGSFYGVLLVFSALIYSGTIAITARSFGEGNKEGVAHCAMDSTLLSLMVGCVLALLAFVFTEDMVRVMFNPDQETLKLATIYLQIIFSGMGPVFAATALRNSLQGIGDTVTPLYIFGFANVINMVLCPLFIYQLHMGIAGAAWALLISNLFSFVAILYMIYVKMFGRDLIVMMKASYPSMERYKKILGIGFWSALQQLARPFTGMLMYRMVYESGGNDGTAAFGIGGQLFNYIFIILVGVSVGISILAGQSLGEKQWEKGRAAVDAGLKLCFINTLIFGIPYVLFPEWFMGMFIQSANVIGIGAEYLRIIYVGLLTVPFTMAYSGAFQGAGDTFPPMVASLVANVVLKLPIGWFLAFPLHMGTRGVWIAVSVSVVIEAILDAFYYFRKDWEAEASL